LKRFTRDVEQNEARCLLERRISGKFVFAFHGYLRCEISIQIAAARVSSLATSQPQSRNADGLRTSCAGSIASVWVVRGVLGPTLQPLCHRARCRAAGRRFNYLLNSCFESHFSPLCQGQFENVRRRLSQSSHIAQPKCRMRLVSLYGVCLALPMPITDGVLSELSKRNHESAKARYKTRKFLIERSNRRRTPSGTSRTRD
jgi:hypothetical protein